MKKLATILLSIMIFVGLRAQSFTEMATMLEAVDDSSVAFADIDGDMDQDVLITGRSQIGGQVAKLYRNDGSGQYSEVATPFFGVVKSSVAFADVDGDLDQDVLITGGAFGSESSSSQLYINDGNGQYTASTASFRGVIDGSVAFADVDGDLDQDILLTGQTSSLFRVVELYINDGFGQFSEASVPFPGVRFSSVAFADVDGDLDQDILITGDASSGPITKLYTNDGNGQFTETTEVFTGVRYSSIAFADVDGDTDQDVLLTGQVSGFGRVAKLYMNDGNGHFTEQSNTPFATVTSSSVAFADVDGDMDQDLLLTGDGSGFSDPVTKLYINDGSGQFVEVAGTPFPGVHDGSVAFADVNGDVALDLLITGEDDGGDPVTQLYAGIANPVVFEVGEALAFDGVDDRITVPPMNIFDEVTNFTISAWVKLDDNTGEQPLFHVLGGSLASIVLGAQSAALGNTPYAFIRPEGGSGILLSGEEVLTTNEWHHLAFTLDDDTNTGTLYINGNAVAVNENIAVSVADFAGFFDDFFLGYSPFSDIGGYLNGQMDEFRITTTASSCYAVQQESQCELPAATADLLLYYQFNQDIANTTVTTLDATVGPDGTMENFALMGMGSDFVEDGAVVTGTLCDLVLESEPTLSGLGMDIPDGDSTPETNDGTDYGDVILGESSTATFEISNTGAGPFLVDTVLSSNPAFEITTVLDNVTVNPGTPITLQVAFNPAAAGSQTATITIATDDCAVGDYTFTVQGNGVECVAPVINGINIVDCGTDFSGVALEIDGELNGAAQWEWTAASFGNIPCEELDAIFAGTILAGITFPDPDSTFYVRAAGGCLDAPVCLAYTPNEILGAPNIGGTVALADGTTDISFCIEIDGTNELSFAATGNSGDNFTFLITDQSNNIEAFDNTGVFDFATLDDGTYRIWGLSYSGNLLLGVGDNPVSDPVSDKCSDLSDNFISVTAKIANAGSIGVIGAGAENDVCVGDGINDNYSFLFQGSEGSSPFFSSYALTDDNDALLQFPISSPFNFETLPAGNYRVRTVLYTGNFTLNLGDNLTTTAISDDCYDFSGNFIAFNLSAVPTVTFTAPGPFAPDAGIQALTGGMPEGGTYSGPGVIDNGDGTYSFDPSIGLGSYTITYTFEVAACNTAANTTDIIVVQEVFLPGDMCMDAIDINTQFGQAPGEVQSSGPYDNTDATTDDSDPDFGWECFGEPDGGGSAPSLERTLWYTFEGDGNNYFIEALACGDDPIDFGDTQFVIYEGPSCDSLEAVLCSEDGPNATGVFFPAGDTLQTEAGIIYYIMVDGFGPDFAADGEFCLEVTNLTEPVVPAMVTFQVDASRLVEAGTLAPEGIFISGEFNGFPDPGTPMVEGADNVWSITLEFPESDTFEYKFQNGPGGWEDIDDSIGDPCTVGDFGNRFVVVEDMDVTTDLVCFNYCVTCDMVVGIDEQTLQASIEVFPNPVRDILNVQVGLPTAAESLNLRLMNTLGQVVLSSNYGQLQSGNIELDVSQLPTGTYLLQVIDGQAQFARPVVVQR